MQAQTIFRTTHHANYTVFGNTLTQSNQLSPRAYRILTYLLSLPDKWQLRVKHLMRHFGFGRDSTYNALKELRKLGYAVLKRGRRTSSWFIYDQPQTEGSDTQPHVEIVAEATTEAAHKIPETKISTFQTTLKSTYTSSLEIKDKTTTAPEQSEPITPIVVVNFENEKHDHAIQQKDLASLAIETTQPAPTVLPECNKAILDNRVNPEIVAEVEKLPVTQAIKPSLVKTFAALTLVEAKAILAILSRAIALGKVQNPVGYAVELTKRAKDGSLTPVAANHQPTLSERLAKQEADRKAEAERHKVSNDAWAESMINKLGLEAFLAIAPWYAAKT